MVILQSTELMSKLVQGSSINSRWAMYMSGVGCPAAYERPTLQLNSSVPIPKFRALSGQILHFLIVL